MSSIHLFYKFLLTIYCSHNELDLPSITSPLMYEKIAARKSVPEIYEAKLIVSSRFSNVHGENFDPFKL